jgi:zinc transporter
VICGLVIGSDRGNTAVDCGQAARWLSARREGGTAEADGSFAWLHFNLAHTGALPWLEEHAALAPEFHHLERDGLHSTRIERTDQSLIAVINDIHFDFAFEPSDLSTLWINVEQHLVVTARRQPLRSVDKLRQAVRAGQPLHLLEQLLRA